MNVKPLLRLEDCWAKTDEQGGPALSVLHHCLNVGAVGLEIASRLTKPLAQMKPKGGAFFVAVHDLGKISPGFLLKSQQWKSQWQSVLRLSMPDSYEARHAWVSQKYLADHLPNPPIWLMAVGGHHGRYLCRQPRPSVFGSHSIGDGIFQKIRQELVTILTNEFLSYLLENPVSD